MFDAHTAGRNTDSCFDTFDFFAVELQKLLIGLVTQVDVYLAERVVHIHNEERRVQISLDFGAIRHDVPTPIEVLLGVGLRDVIELAGFYREGVDLLECTASIYNLAFQDINKGCRRFIGNGFPKTLFPHIFTFVVLLGLLGPLCESTEPHLLNEVLAAETNQFVRQLVVLLHPQLTLPAIQLTAQALQSEVALGAYPAAASTAVDALRWKLRLRDDSAVLTEHHGVAGPTRPVQHPAGEAALPYPDVPSVEAFRPA